MGRNESSTRPRPTRRIDADAPALHPRNRHRGHYDFDALIAANPALAPFVRPSPRGTPTVDFADAGAVRQLNRALLATQYGVRDWYLPEGWLCPPVPGRADYLHGLADLLAADNGGAIPRGSAVRALDIGTGASCIYPLLGRAQYGWNFVGSDVDADALTIAGRNVTANPDPAAAIELRLQRARDAVLAGIVDNDERFDLVLCNPPFHQSAREAVDGSQRKWRNLGRTASGRQPPHLNFGGRAAELWCPGGEAGFIRRMIDDSTGSREQVLWFSSLVAKSTHLKAIQQQLRDCAAAAVRVVPMAQGSKQSRFVAWSFHDETNRTLWSRARKDA